MKKNKWLIPLATLSLLIAGCGGGGKGGDGDGLDAKIEQFLSDTELVLPSVEDFVQQHIVWFNYENQAYFIEGYGEDADNSIENTFNSDLTALGAIWTNLNDDTYTVEDYGYIYGDADEENYTISLNFYSYENMFYFRLTRWDQQAGELDVSGVDTNWYVDYLYDGFAKITDIGEYQANFKAFLEVDTDILLPEADYHIVGIQEAGEDEYGDQIVNSIISIYEGDIVDEYKAYLEDADYEVTVTTSTEYEIDWEAYEIIEVTVNTYSAFNADHTVVISFVVSNGYTQVNVANFADIYTDVLTTDTEWNADLVTLMNEDLEMVLPFVALGDGYKFEEGVEEYDDASYPYIVIYDNYYQNLLEGYDELLLGNGFTYYPEDDDYYEHYYLDSETLHVEVYIDYADGNQILAYYEPVGGSGDKTEPTEDQVVDTLNPTAFALDGSTSYKDYTFNSENGLSYAAQCANGNQSIQLRSKNNNSGIVATANTDSLTLAAINVSIEANTTDGRVLDIYAGTSAFTIADMYSGAATKVGSITYATGTDNYTFAFDAEAGYTYFGVRSDNGAIYVLSIEVILNAAL